MFFLSTTFISILFALFGLIVGSFLNVVILRHNKKTLGGRSECPHCHKQLAWYELIPVISFVIQAGKCRGCKKQISTQYSIVELITAFVFFVSGFYLQNYIITLHHPLLSIIAVISFLTTVSYAIIISVYDIKTKLVPLVWFIGLVVSSIIFLINYYVIIGFYAPSLLPHLVGLIICTPFLFIWTISGGKWIGFADIEIIAWIGLCLGAFSGVMAVLSAFYMGALFAILFIIFKKLLGFSYKTIRTIQIPFTPFLILAWFISTVSSWDFFSLITSFFL